MNNAPDIVIGPPGTGKTTRLLGMVEEALARGVPPERVGFITFTKLGAGEAAERAAIKFGLTKSRLRWFRTIHSLCFQAVSVNSGDVLEGKKILEFGDWIGTKLSPSYSMEEGSTFGYEAGDRAMFMENLARVRCIPLRQQYDQNDDNLPWTLVERIARGLAEFKRNRGLVDYTDMLQMFVDGSWIPELDELYVDEGQDLSELQWRVVWKIAEGVWARGGRVVVAGDDDQAIYRWAGAAVERFVDMPGRVQVLGQSWRVPSSAQELCAEIIGRVRHRRPKEWKPRQLDDKMRGEGLTLNGEIRRVGKFYDADIWGKDVLILGRNAFYLRPVMDWLRSEGCVFEWRGHPSVTRSTMEAIVSWERLRKGEAITGDEARTVYDRMSSGVGVKRGHKKLTAFGENDQVTMKDLMDRGGLMTDRIWHEALDRVPAEERSYMLRARQRGESLQKRPRVRVGTMHGAKGGQADHVIVLRDMASRTYAEMRENPEDEHRVQYVAASRTRQLMTVVAPTGRASYDI